MSAGNLFTYATGTSNAIAIPPRGSYALVVQNEDGSTLLRAGYDGTVTGDLVVRHPEARPALEELAGRLSMILIGPASTGEDRKPA